ncbi:MAG: hypothetical protein A2508_04225 [Candidatus Lambdaproteobacteria bacterium RIFOXYD12_FULL_49_8]|nr:MAG: hypothetical protein A2508_04225 [Candidatus Lambdaproteobacteria bacterium RIFOXYD12_FULL_49_8]
MLPVICLWLVIKRNYQKQTAQKQDIRLCIYRQTGQKRDIQFKGGNFALRRGEEGAQRLPPTWKSLRKYRLFGGQVF